MPVKCNLLSENSNAKHMFITDGVYDSGIIDNHFVANSLVVTDGKKSNIFAR